MAQTLVKKMHGIDIYVDPDDGRFFARIGTRVMRRKDLRAIEREIAATASPVTLSLYSSHSATSVEHVEVIGVTENRAVLKDGRTLRYPALYLPDPELESQLASVYAEWEKLRDQQSEVMRRWQSLVRENGRQFSLDGIKKLLAEARAQEGEGE